MTTVEWRDRCIAHFQSGKATEEQWHEMAEILLTCSENGDLDQFVGLDEAVDPNYGKVNP